MICIYFDLFHHVDADIKRFQFYWIYFQEIRYPQISWNFRCAAAALNLQFFAPSFCCTEGVWSKNTLCTHFFWLTLYLRSTRWCSIFSTLWILASLGKTFEYLFARTWGIVVDLLEKGTLKRRMHEIIENEHPFLLLIFMLYIYL